MISIEFFLITKIMYAHARLHNHHTKSRIACVQKRVQSSSPAKNIYIRICLSFLQVVLCLIFNILNNIVCFLAHTLIKTHTD